MMESLPQCFHRVTIPSWSTTWSIRYGQSIASRKTGSIACGLEERNTWGSSDPWLLRSLVVSAGILGAALVTFFSVRMLCVVRKWRVKRNRRRSANVPGLLVVKSSVSCGDIEPGLSGILQSSICLDSTNNSCAEKPQHSSPLVISSIPFPCMPPPRLSSCTFAHPMTSRLFNSSGETSPYPHPSLDSTCPTLLNCYDIKSIKLGTHRTEASSFLARRAVSQPLRRMTIGRATELADWRTRSTTAPVEPSPLRGEVSPRSSKSSWSTDVTFWTPETTPTHQMSPGVTSIPVNLLQSKAPCNDNVIPGGPTQMTSFRRGCRAHSISHLADYRTHSYTYRSLMSLPAPVVTRSKRTLSAPAPCRG